MENLIQSANLFKDLNPFFKLINQHDDSPCLVILKWFFEWEFKVNLPWQSKKYFWLLFSTHEFKKTPMNKKKLWKNNAQKTRLYEKKHHTHICPFAFPEFCLQRTRSLRPLRVLNLGRSDGSEGVEVGSLSTLWIFTSRELTQSHPPWLGVNSKKRFGKKRIEMDGNGKLGLVFFFFVCWKFQRLLFRGLSYTCSSTWANVFFIANCVIFNDSSNDLSFVSKRQHQPNQKKHVRKTWRINVAINLLILGSTKGLYPKKLSKNTVWLRWMSFFSCSFLLATKKPYTQNGKTHSCKGFSVPHVFVCEWFSGNTVTTYPASFNGVLYFGWALTFQF